MSNTGRRGWVGVDRHWLADPDLSNSALRLMLWLDSHSDDYRAALDVKRCAGELGWKRDTVTRALKQLETLGLVSTEQVPSTRSRSRTRITLHQSKWSDRDCARKWGTPEPDEGAHPVPENGAPTTSTPSGEESSRGTLVVDELGDARHLCTMLADALELNGSNRPNITAGWLADMERLVRIDGRQVQEVEQVIRWLAKRGDDVSSFWGPNIRSPRKLRQKWDAMADQYRTRTRPKAPRPDDGVAYAKRKVAEAQARKAAGDAR